MSDLKSIMPLPNAAKNTACPYCQRHFLSPDELTMHIVTRHTRNGKGRGLPAQSGSSKS
jgi:hypothetical protein